MDYEYWYEDMTPEEFEEAQMRYHVMDIIGYPMVDATDNTLTEEAVFWEGMDEYEQKHESEKDKEIREMRQSRERLMREKHDEWIDESEIEKSLVLKTEMVPQPLHRLNLRLLAGRNVWDEIRKATYFKYNHKCTICSGTGRMNAHEIWEYDDINHVQILKGFICLCDLCHHVKHLGHAERLGMGGKLNFYEVVEHFMRLNNCGADVYSIHRATSVHQYNIRSKHEWTVDFGEYKDFISDTTSK